jgi:hypothetical protein
MSRKLLSSQQTRTKAVPHKAKKPLVAWQFVALADFCAISNSKIPIIRPALAVCLEIKNSPRKRRRKKKIALHAPFFTANLRSDRAFAVHFLIFRISAVTIKSGYQFTEIFRKVNRPPLACRPPATE